MTGASVPRSSPGSELTPSSCFAGAWSVLFSKSITYIITAAWPSQVVDWYSWFCVLAFVGSAAFWIKATNQGLHLFSSSLIIPLMQACWTAQSIIE